MLRKELGDYFHENGIKLDYDPETSVLTTWYGKEVPVKFDKRVLLCANYNKSSGEINIDTSLRSIDEIANIALHESGHAQVSTGRTILTDWTMIPAVYLTANAIAIQAAATPEITIGADNYVTYGMASMISILMFRYLISEAIAEGYKWYKKIQGKVNRLFEPAGHPY